MRNMIIDETNLSIEYISHLIAVYSQSSTPYWLDNFDVTGNETGNYRKAAVLVPMLKKNAAWHILFTKRSEYLEEHRGQVSFPGGRIEDKDISAEHAALRETHEEIGIPSEKIFVLGSLREIPSITNFLITPVIGVLDYPLSLKIQKQEVSNVFTIPLKWLANPSNFQVFQRDLPEPFSKVNTIYYKSYKKNILWGISAKIIQIFISVLNQEIK